MLSMSSFAAFDPLIRHMVLSASMSPDLPFAAVSVTASRSDSTEYPAFVLQDDAKARAAEDGSFPEIDEVMGTRIGRRYDEDAVSFDIYDVIGRYPGDVLILHGDRDGIVPLRYSQRAAEVWPAARLVVMPGQDHGFAGEARAEAMLQEAAFLLAH